MRYPNVSQTILTSTRILRLVLVFITAYLLGKFGWWLAKPLGYISINTSISKNIKPEGIAQGIVNRAPFGVITETKVLQPSIVSQIDVTGVYAGGTKNSIAFILINGKNSIASIGDDIQGSKLKLIQPDGIVITQGGQDITIKISEDKSSSNDTTSSNMPNTPAQYSNNSAQQQPINSNNQAPDNQNNSNNVVSNGDSNNNQTDDLAAKRKKMIEAFQNQNNGNSTPPTNN